MKIYQQFLSYLVAIGSTAIALLLTLWLKSLLSPIISPLFYIAIVVSAWYGGFRPGSVAIVLSMLAIDYLLLPPSHQIWPDRPDDILRLGIYLIVALVINLLTSNLQESKKKIEQLNKQLIQENAEQLGLALSAARMGMWDWNLVTGEIKWSAEHALLLGLTPDAFDGKYEAFEARVHPEDRPALNQALQQALQTKSIYHHEFRIVWPDGSQHWVEGRGQGFYNRTGEAVQMTGTVMNVDDRKQAETLLYQQFQQQSLVMEISQRIRQSLNLQEILQTTVEEVRRFLQCDRALIFQITPDYSGTILVESVNPAWNAISSNYRYDPCVGKEYIEPFQQGLVTAKSDIYTAEIAPCHREMLASFQVRANLVVPILQGENLWGLLIVHHCAAPRQWQTPEIELLRQLSAQASIAIQQADLFEQVQKEVIRIQTLFNTSFDGIVILDREGNVLDANPRFAEMLGYTEKEIASLNVLDWDAHFTSAELEQMRSDCIIVKNRVFETCHRRKDGTIYDVEICSSVVEWQGEMVYFCISRDITDRKQAEIALQQLNAELEQRVMERTAELRESEQKFRQLAENIQAVFWITDVQNRQILYVSNAYETVWQNKCEDAYQDFSNWLDAVHPEDRHRVEAALLEQETTGQSDIKYRIIRPDGSICWIRDRAFAIRDETGTILRMAGIAEDITFSKQAEESLRQKSRKEQLLFSITQTIRQSLDLNAILNNAVTEVRQILQADRVAIYRFYPDFSGDFVVESVGEDWVKLVGDDIQKVWQDTYLQETQGGRFRNKESTIVNDIYQAELQPCHIELLAQFQAKSYGIFPIFQGEILWGLLGIYQNSTSRNWQSWEIELLEQIASQLSLAIQQSQLYQQLQIELQERQQAEAAIREAERRWRSLLDNVHLLVVGLDRSGNVNYVNPFLLKIAGYTKDEVLGKNWFKNFVPPSNRESTKADFWQVLHHQTDPYHRNPILTKFGEELFIAWNNTTLQDSEGNIIGTIGIGEDITEREKVEKIKNEFIGVVSHELRTPLTAIQMSLGLLNMGIYDKKPEKSRRMIEIALLDTNRLVNLVNDILDLERLESGQAVLEKTVCKAADLMQQAVNGIHTIASQQQISLIIAPTDIQVWAAADAIVQTLTNLLSNGIKFSPNGSTIHLSAENQTDGVLFRVRDRGRGIPADKLELIFGRFQQVDASDSREKGGTGLGLAICQSIIERHGGKIWAESILGEGSTFFFTLPCL